MSILTSTLPARVIAALLLAATMTGSAAAAPAHHPIALRGLLQGQLLQVRGHNFAPGAHVAIVLVDTRTWTTLIKRSAIAEPARYQCSTRASGMCCRRVSSVMCGHRDSHAGALYAQA